MAVQKNRKKISTMEAARMLDVAVSSISKWIDEGVLQAGRTPGGHRRIEKEDLIQFLQKQNLRIPSELLHSGAKLLIVDDEMAFAKLLTAEIKERCPTLEVIEAHDGYAAGETVALANPDTIVLDLRLPGIDGFEVCRRIKANPLTRHISIIAITGDAAPEARSRILSLGATSCLDKSMGMETIVNEIVKGIARPLPA